MKQIATALFANSPFTKGKPNGYLSMRRCFLQSTIKLPCISQNICFPLTSLLFFLHSNSHAWTDFDKNRTGMIPFVFDDSFG